MLMKSVIIACLVTLSTADIGLELQKDPNYTYDAPLAPLTQDSHDEVAVRGGEAYSGGQHQSGGESSYSSSGGVVGVANDAAAATEEEVQKHFYVFGANEDEEEVAAPAIVQPAKKQTHYKIIFIKAPSQDRVHQQILAQAPKRDEKTIVYVLVKKPEDAATLIQQQQEAYKPNKPEVFFIKYKGGKPVATSADGSADFGPVPQSRLAEEEQPQEEQPHEEQPPEEQFSLSSLVPSGAGAESAGAQEAPEEEPLPADETAAHAEAPADSLDDYLPPAKRRY